MSETNDAVTSPVERVVSVRVKTMRLKLELSQLELAKKSGLTSAAISKIEKDGRDIAISSAKKLAATLGVSIDYLAGAVIYPDTEMTLRIELTKLRQRMYKIGDLVKAH